MFRIINLVTAIFFFAITDSYAEIPLPPDSAPKEVVKFTGQGINPKSLTMTIRDGSVFFVNLAENSPVNLEIDYGQKRMHCHSKNLTLDDKGIMRSVKAIEPQDFAIMCFPEAGTYKYKVKDISNADRMFRGTVIVK